MSNFLREKCAEIGGKCAGCFYSERCGIYMDDTSMDTPDKSDREIIREAVDEECPDDDMAADKADAAWVLGLEEGSDEWNELMDI